MRIPGPSRLGLKRPGPNISGAKRPRTKYPGAKRPGPKCMCAKRPGPKRPCLKRPGVKHGARCSHFVKLNPIKYQFSVVEGKSGLKVTKAVDAVTKCVAVATQFVNE